MEEIEEYKDWLEFYKNKVKNLNKKLFDLEKEKQRLSKLRQYNLSELSLELEDMSDKEISSLIQQLRKRRVCCMNQINN